MVKAKARGLKNKKIILIVSLVGLILLAATGYYGYTLYQSNATKQKAAASEAQKEADKLNIVGDGNLATQYIAALKANQNEKAQKLFTDKVSSESDTQKKLDLYAQNVQLALSYQHPDQAVEASLKAVEIRLTHDVYAQVATAYVGKFDFKNQAAYLQKALDAVKASDDPNKDMYIQVYEQKLASANEALKVKQ
jgi:hypothetical protein